MNNDWLAVFEALDAVYKDLTFSNIAVNEAVSRRKGCRCGFVRTFAKGVLRDTIRLDYIIDGLAINGISSIRRKALTVLRMGIYALDRLDSVPDYAALSEAVELARLVTKGREGFVNAILREYLRRREEFNDKLLEPYIRYSFKKDIYELLENQYGSEAEEIAAALNETPGLFLRTNTLKTDRASLIDKLSDAGIESAPCELNSEAIITAGGELADNGMFSDGLYSIQSLSSMKAVKALGPEPGSRVLDLCAAPGGKTCYMAELMKDRGQITACDIYDHRLDLIKASVKRLGIHIVELYKCDACVQETSLENFYDYVLADVPCSGLGVAASKPEIKLTSNPSDYDGLIGIQTEILSNAVLYARPGGRIEYSTCTLNRNENEGVVKHILSRYDSLIRVIETETIMPYNGMAGFFYCILEKNPS